MENARVSKSKGMRGHTSPQKVSQPAQNFNCCNNLHFLLIYIFFILIFVCTVLGILLFELNFCLGNVSHRGFQVFQLSDLTFHLKCQMLLLYLQKYRWLNTATLLSYIKRMHTSGGLRHGVPALRFFFPVFNRPGVAGDNL